jgi:hypothetical protein
MAPEPSVDIAFDCQPLRSIARLDVPLDASDRLRHRAGLIKGAVETYGAERTYYLYNARCVFRFANSEIDGLCRFEFEGVVRTDVGDRKCVDAQLEIRLVSETCGGVPEPVKAWLYDRVRQAVAIEFDRFIAAGQLPAQNPPGEAPATPADLSGIAGLDV